MSGPTFLLIGNPQNRRATFFQEALAVAGCLPAHVLSYVEAANGGLERFADARDLVVRLEAPSGDFEIERTLLEWGADEQDPAALTTRRLSAHEIQRLVYQQGRVNAPRQWYLGYCALLDHLKIQLPLARWMNAPDDVKTMFDKPTTSAHCVERGIPVPPAVQLSSYEEVRQWMGRLRRRQVFVKMRNGSSASGVVALRARRDGALAAWTSGVMEGGELHNSLRIRRYTNERTIADLIDHLADIGGLHVEVWVPKAKVDGGSFDLRQVIIAGEPTHAVARVSRSPMTNLHLGNKRGNMEVVRAKLGSVWQDIESLSRRVALAFPNTHYAGLDVLVTPSLRRVLVVEVNAFGDLLPRITWNGMTTYEAEVDAWLKKAN